MLRPVVHRAGKGELIGLTQLWGFLRVRKRLWVPIVVMTLIFGGLILLSEGVGLMPFTYTRL